MTSIEREKIEALARKAKAIRDLWLREPDEVLPIQGSAQAEARRLERLRQSEQGKVNENTARIQENTARIQIATVEWVATDNEKEMPE